jgi:hypothetical protein
VWVLLSDREDHFVNNHAFNLLLFKKQDLAGRVAEVVERWQSMRLAQGSAPRKKARHVLLASGATSLVWLFNIK